MQGFWSSPNMPLKQQLPSLGHLAKQLSVRTNLQSSHRDRKEQEKRLQKKKKSLYLLHQRSGFRQHFGKGVAKDDGVFSFAVLYDVVGQVEEVQSVSEASWKQREKQRTVIGARNPGEGSCLTPPPSTLPFPPFLFLLQLFFPAAISAGGSSFKIGPLLNKNV